MNLQRLCLKGHDVICKPMLRRRGNTLWTVATDGRSLLAVRGKHSDHIGEKIPVRGIFRATSFREKGWRPAAFVPWVELRDFVRTRHVNNGLDYEPVSIAGATIDAALLRRFAYGLKADTVTIRATVDTMPTWGHSAIRIDAKNWSIVVMAMLQKPVAEFRAKGAMR